MLYIYEHGNLSEKCKTLLFTIKMSLYHVHDLLYFYWKNKQHVSLKLMRSTTCNTAIYIDCEIILKICQFKITSFLTSTSK